MSPQVSEADIPSLIKTLDAAKKAIPEDVGARRALYNSARSLALALEAPRDSTLRISYSVSIPQFVVLSKGRS